MASGIKEAFQKAAKAAFNAAGNVKETVTYRKKTNTNPSYDPSTDTVTDAYTDYTSVNMIPEGFETTEVDGQSVLLKDEKMMCLVETLDDLSITPKMNDSIIRSSVVWDIVSKHKDAADAVWTFQIREP